MTDSIALSRPVQPARRSSQKIMALLIIFVGLALISGSVLYGFAAQRDANPALAYGPEDIAREQPLRAVHEMDMPG